MMKYLITLLFLSIQLSAIEVLTEAKVGYFIPTDAKFRSVYGEDGIIGGIETSVGIGSHFYPWVSASMYDNSGHWRAIQNKTEIYFIPIGVGLKYIYPFKYVSIYGGAGALPTYLHITNNSPLALHTQSKWGCGGTVKVGFIANRLWNFFIDLFAEYSYIKIPFPNSHHKMVELSPANLSNFTIGGGVGYWFGPSPRESEEES